MRTEDTVIFDFDGTLVSRDSFLDFAVRYCVRRPERLLLVAMVTPLAVLLGVRSRTSAASLLLWAMTVGTRTRSFVLELRHYARRTLPGYASDAIFAELGRHVGSGCRVVIATGSVPFLVRELFAARGLVRPQVVGSRFRRRWGGFVAASHCIGHVKLLELERRLGVVEWSTVYTDSFLDRSLISRARSVTLVSPSARTLSRTRRLLGQGRTLRVLRLRGDVTPD